MFIRKYRRYILRNIKICSHRISSLAWNERRIRMFNVHRFTEMQTKLARRLGWVWKPFGKKNFKDASNFEMGYLLKLNEKSEYFALVLICRFRQSIFPPLRELRSSSTVAANEFRPDLPWQWGVDSVMRIFICGKLTKQVPASAKPRTKFRSKGFFLFRFFDGKKLFLGSGSWINAHTTTRFRSGTATAGASKIYIISSSEPICVHSGEYERNRRMGRTNDGTIYRNGHYFVSI